MRATLRILVPFDFSDGSRRALAHVLAWSAHAPCEIHVAHVVEDALEERASDEAGRLAHWYQELERATEREVRQLPALRDRTGPIEYHLSVGRSERDIVKIAKRLAVDLIVIGTHRRTRLAPLPVGSVAGGVIRDSPCPVLTVHPQSFPSPVVQRDALAGAPTHAG